MSRLVSIIIPFYNEEQYLSKAIDSAIAQSYIPTEIVLVDDGSTDESLAIARQYMDNHNNIQLVSVKNKGLGNARNVGMSVAKGVYLTFLDSDDQLCTTAVEVWVKKIAPLYLMNSINITLSLQATASHMPLKKRDFPIHAIGSCSAGKFARERFMIFINSYAYCGQNDLRYSTERHFFLFHNGSIQ